MNIKDKIGQRILTERKAKKLTRQALADLTDDLKQSRINNWERGLRTPGPEEIKQLAVALDVSPAFLMCLTDNKHLDSIPNGEINKLIPILNVQQACDPKAFMKTAIDPSQTKEISFFPINNELVNNLSGCYFALKMNDNSMEPELFENDILLIDIEANPKPGKFVIAKLEGSMEIIVRRLKQLSFSSAEQSYELLAINSHWASIQNNDETKCELIGTIIGIYRKLD